jgi:ribosome maturation factor RimP
VKSHPSATKNTERRIARQDAAEDLDEALAEGVPAQSLFESIPAEVRANLESLLAERGVVAVASVLRGSDARRVVELYVDKDSQDGIMLEQCRELSLSIGEILDAATVFKGTYRLDVSSPGVDRPLVFPWQYKRNVGRLLHVELKNGASGKGRITAVSETNVVLESVKKLSKTAQSKLDASPADPLVLTLPATIAFADIFRAVVEIEF